MGLLVAGYVCALMAALNLWVAVAQGSALNYAAALFISLVAVSNFITTKGAK